MNQVPSGSILLVEDDPDIQESIADLLELEGYTVHRADHGGKALEFLQTGASVQLILLDLMMPVMDGFQFREEVLKDPRLAEIPILIMSADGHIMEKMAQIGAKSYLKKPVDVDVFIHTVRGFFDKLL